MRPAACSVDGHRVLILLESRDTRTDRFRLIRQHQAFGVAFVLCLRVIREGSAQRDHVIREDASFRVTDDRGDRLGLTGDLGLATERLQLAAYLAREVAETREVRLHRVELANGLLLATSMLEDPGGFLDESATVLRGGLEDRVEAPLTDDHVHLATQSRVAQQLLDVE